MTSSQIAFLAKILSGGSLPVSGEPIPDGQLAYFRERLKTRIFSFIVKGFLDQQKACPQITQASIARRLHRRPEQINRWLSGPANMTLDTVSDLVLAVYGGEPSISFSPLVKKTQEIVAAQESQTVRRSSADVIMKAAVEVPLQMPPSNGHSYRYLNQSPTVLGDLGLTACASNENDSTELLKYNNYAGQAGGV